MRFASSRNLRITERGPKCRARAEWPKPVSRRPSGAARRCQALERPAVGGAPGRNGAAFSSRAVEVSGSISMEAGVASFSCEHRLQHRPAGGGVRSCCAGSRRPLAGVGAGAMTGLVSKHGVSFAPLRPLIALDDTSAGQGNGPRRARYSTEPPRGFSHVRRTHQRSRLVPRRFRLHALLASATTPS